MSRGPRRPTPAPAPMATYGASFPVGAPAGWPFYRTDMLESFHYTGAKWLADRTLTPAWTNQAIILAGGFFRLFQANVQSATLGYRIPWDATLVEVIAQRSTVGLDSRFDVYAGAAGATLLHQHTVPAADQSTNETGLDLDVAADDLLNARAGTDVTGGGVIVCIFRRRAS